MPVCKKCNLTFPNWVKVNEETKNLSSRKYCLNCSPWGQHNTRPIIFGGEIGQCLCQYCGETNSVKFYGNHRKTTCRSCHNKDVNKRQQDNRKYAIEKLGGKCIYCGFDKWVCSLAIHHLDPNKKDNNFIRFKSWCRKRMDRELENCVLLCHNCHAALHNGFINLGM